MKSQILLSAIFFLSSSQAFSVGVGRIPSNQPVDPLSKIKLEGSPFEVCQDSLLISKSQFDKNSDLWKKAIGECGLKVEILPDAGFFKSIQASLAEEDTAEKSVEFLTKVGTKAVEKLSLNNELAEHFKNCAAKESGGKEAEEATKWFAQKLQAASNDAEKKLYDASNCSALVDRVKDRAKAAGARARTAKVVLEATKGAWKTFTDARDSLLNYLGGGKLPIDSVAATEAEKAEAKKMMQEDDALVQKEFNAAIEKNKEILAQAEAKGISPDKAEGLDPWFLAWKRSWENDPAGKSASHFNYKTSRRGVGGAKEADMRGATDFLDEIRAKNFARHQKDYFAAVEEVPVLSYLGTADPKNADLLEASKKVLKNGQDELKSAKDLLAKGKEQPGKKISDKDRAESMFDLMKYGPLVGEALKENPAYCKTATGIANIVLSADFRHHTLVAGGLIGATLLTGGVGMYLGGTAALVGLGVAPVLFASNTLYSTDGLYAEYSKAKQAANSAVDTVELGSKVFDAEKADEKLSEAALTVSLLPLDFIGSSATLKAGRALLEATTAEGKAAAEATLKQTLKQNGVEDSKANKLISDLKDGKAADKTKAAREILKKYNIPEDQVELVSALSKKGFLRYQDPKEIEGVLREVDKDTARRAIALLEKNLKEGEELPFNEGLKNRIPALKALLAGAKFGSRPEQIVSSIKDWDGPALLGLAATYKEASQKIASGAYAGLKAEEQQAKAFDDTLKEKGVSDAEQIKQMRSCAGVAK